jgi:hypothetical protein
MTHLDPDEPLARELRDIRRPPEPPADAMWTAVAPHLPRRAGVSARAVLWPAGLAVAASLLIWVSASRAPMPEGPRPVQTPLAAAAGALETAVDVQWASLPPATARTTRESLQAMTGAIDDLRALTAASPADEDLRWMLDRLERRRLEAMWNTLEEIAAAEQLHGRRPRRTM